MNENLQLDALEAERDLRRRVIALATSYRPLRDKRMLDLCRTAWASDERSGGVVGQLWVECLFPSKTSGTTLKALADRGQLSETLVRMLDRPEAYPKARELYRHQEEVILTALHGVPGSTGHARPAIVVTAGTGAGKTESFLLPILNDLCLRQRAAGEEGVRAILLYPMNALVNDQVERLFNWLSGQQDGDKPITFMHFTSETPDNKKRLAHSSLATETRHPCRLLTREEGRASPPDILITNYSMLEYMLCRPQDAPFFGSALRSMVLDEAHLYSGTLAADICMLLRRVLERCSVDAENILQIATSATLGGNAEDLGQFIASIFSKPPDLVYPIFGIAHKRLLPAAEAPGEDAKPAQINCTALEQVPFVDPEARVLLQDKATAASARACVSPLVADKVVEFLGSETIAARVLHEALSRAPLVHTLDAFFWSEREKKRTVIPLRQIAEHLFPGEVPSAAERATTALLQMCARARLQADDLPLIPHKLHLQVRAPGHFSVWLNASCTKLESSVSGAGMLIADLASACPECHGATLTLSICGTCGEWLLAGSEQDGRLRLRSHWYAATEEDLPSGVNSRHRFFTPEQSHAEADCFLDLDNRSIRESSTRTAALKEHFECPNCGGDLSQFAPMQLPDSLTLPTVAESVLAAMPPRADSAMRKILPAAGRQLLAFSDSRRQAARLGPHLTYQHEILLARGLMTRVLDDRPDPLKLQAEIEEAECVLGSVSATSVRQMIEDGLKAKREELSSAKHGRSMSQWARVMSEREELQQFFARDAAGKHSAKVESGKEWRLSWQEAWDANTRTMRKKTSVLLGREFLIHRSHSMETLGLAEVCYPGLDSCHLPVLDRLRRSELDSLALHWHSFLACLCDLLRGRGFISFGEESDEDGHNDETILSFPIGRWFFVSKRRYTHRASNWGSARNSRARFFVA